ncbi:putative secreted protein [Rhodopirellula maiorica SM1]|uniref:Putative secreted protein n=1 Tax=Rhodopirellula maiorica SM1 TaxID=1265738 RepID=M5RWI3_9BACT|nr:YdjY domain-containing protein [Rhodopirellula maiorica]EMI19762.1 putative secreted protein [Rhodopirellula maiorica SM1]
MPYFAKTLPTFTLVVAFAAAQTVGCGRESTTPEPVELPSATMPPTGENERNEAESAADSTGSPNPIVKKEAAPEETRAVEPTAVESTAVDSTEPSTLRQLPMVDEKSEDEDLVKETAAEEGNSEDGPSAEMVTDSDADEPEPPMEEPEPQMSPQEFLSKQFAPPPGAKRLSQDSLLWVDRELNRVYIDGYVAIDRGALEMFACPVGSKEHESIVAVVAKSSEVHAALLVVGAKTGTTAMFTPNFVPPTGQAIRVWVSWRDKQGKFHIEDARRWVQDTESKKSVEADWVFAGSGFYRDEEDGREYYRADGGDMICVSNFSTAMMDLSLASSADADSLLFRPFEGRVPERGTPVRLILVPIPVPTDGPAKELTAEQDPNVKPKEKVLPVRSEE